MAFQVGWPTDTCSPGLFVVVSLESSAQQQVISLLSLLETFLVLSLGLCIFYSLCLDWYSLISPGVMCSHFFLNFPSLPGYLRIAFVPVTCYPPVLPHLELWNTHCYLKLCSLHLYLWMVSSIRKQVLWPQRVSVFHSLLCPACLEKCFELSRCSTNIRWKKKWIKLRRNIICNLVTKIVPCAKHFVINIDKL